MSDNEKILNQLGELKNQKVLVHIRDGAIIEGVFEYFFHPYGNVNQPLHVAVNGEGDTYAHIKIDDIKFISDNEIVLID